MNLIKKNILKKLEEVIDPELNISIVDLGLIYDVKIDKKNKLKIIMTLTTIGCPLISVIEEDIKNKISELGFSKEKIIIDLTFDPPWTIEKMSKKAKAILGII
ncbi:MAG: metal-sulfur cluster assembly factor [Patescibacteria group bacterium]|nr:metal-sulfur cluster assembly factor [Patescibacteria group bacterium]